MYRLSVGFVDGTLIDREYGTLTEIRAILDFLKIMQDIPYTHEAADYVIVAQDGSTMEEGLVGK